MSVSSARSIQSMCSQFHFSNIQFYIFFPSTSISSRWPLSLSFPTIPMYAQVLSPIHATCHALLILLDLIARILVGKGTNHEAPHFSLLHFPPTFSFLGPNIFLSTPSWNTISIYPSLSVRNQFAHLCEAMCKIVRKCTFYLYILG